MKPTIQKLNQAMSVLRWHAREDNGSVAAARGINAAAHAVALYAGKKVINYETKQPLVYNKENLLNPWFIVE